MPSQVLGASRTGGKAFCDGMGYHTGTFPHTGLRHERHYRMPHGDGRRNRSGEKVYAPARWVVIFRAGKDLREAIDARTERKA